MFENKIKIPLTISDHKVELIISGEPSQEETIIEKSDAFEFGEASVQIKEGYYYEYKLSEGFNLQSSEVVTQSKLNPSTGRIAPNIFVGTLSLDILDLRKNEKCGEVKLEVQSVKASYREDYRFMLEEITEKCTDLLLQHGSPVFQTFEVDFNADAITLYQRFAFLKSILDSSEFNDSVYKFLTSPVTRWEESETEKDIRSIRRISNNVLRQFTTESNRVDLPLDHPLKSTLQSIPLKIRIIYKSETVDTPENRFVKHALKSFQSLCGRFRSNLNEDNRLKEEAILLEDKLEQFLSHSLFKKILAPTSLPLNSPVLQRKEGYREILRAWLMLDLAAKLVWRGGNDVYSGGKRDVAVLYEYWLFFILLDIIKDVFKIEPEGIQNLITKTKDGLGLQLKQGKHLPVKGTYNAGSRKLDLEFSYNKTFKGDNKYPASGSWTKSMRPDYTLSIWPHGINSELAEEQELITHIHFDAKYKVENLKAIFGSDEDFNNEKEEQRNGTFKRADLLKMHTYKDAIRRTEGSYILYPGTEPAFTRTGFHEIIPGLGAFAIRPTRQKSGVEDVKNFLKEVVTHFLNRASQREKMSLKTFETHMNKNSNQVTVTLPEPFGKNRNLLPDDTFVLVGFYKDYDHLNWIIRNGLYNVRTGTTRGSLRISPKETGAKYLLLHTRDETKTGRLLKLKETGPRIFSKKDLIKKSYINPSQEFYLVFDIEEAVEKEFENMTWDISRLEGYTGARLSTLPFSVSLTELMKSLVK